MDETIKEPVAEETTEKNAKSSAKADKKEIAKLTEENKSLSAELEKTKSELTAQNDKYLRMIAEYDNFRKRSSKEKEAAYADACTDVLASILPVMDNLERALLYTETGEGGALLEGVKMTLKQFEDALKRCGVEAFGVRGDDFDPRFHNAIMQVEDAELGSGKVAEVLQKGYRKGDKIIRDAMVKVSG